MKPIYRLILISACLVGLASCDKKLELYPYSSIELSQSFKTLKDAQAYDNGILGNLRGRLYGLYTISQDVQADQLNASLEYGNRNGNPHRWGTSFLADDYTIRDVWSGYYFMLKNVNAAIGGYPNISASSTAEKQTLDRYLGNAYMARAFLYSELIIRWAKAYDPATASTDMGVPLVLEYNPSQQPARATVKEVYDQILSDITKAKTLLVSATGSKGAKRFTIHSVYALEARVKLNTRDWAGAKIAAEEVINSGVYNLYTTEAGLRSMWKNDETQETIQQAFVSAPNELANANSIYLGLIPASGKFRPDFIPSQWVVDKYENADFRKTIYFEKKELDIQGVSYPNIWLVNKYEGNPTLFTGATTNYQHAPKIFRLAELYLIAAEAGSNLGGTNEASALNHLNTLRKARGLTALEGLTGGSLLKEIKDERFRELAFEGFRLWDIKRWGEGFVRSSPQNLNIIITGTGFQGLSIAANDPKFTWAIPANDMTTNPNLAGAQNPGW